MGAASLRILEDGGNPRETTSFRQLSADAFEIHPYWENESAAYRFRLEFAADNASRKQQSVRLEIEWQDRTYGHLRDHLYLKGPADPTFRVVPALAVGSRTVAEVILPPGTTEIAMQPRYGYADYQECLHRVPGRPGILREFLGKTPGGREMCLVGFSSRGGAAKQSILAVARLHPYETASSYCAEGILRFLVDRAEEKASALLEQFDVWVVPMANPDGVSEGLTRLTRAEGIDLSKCIDTADGTCRLLKEAVDRVRPDIYVEFHNWMNRGIDGIYGLGLLDAWLFKRKMPEPKPNRWRTMLRWGFLPQGRLGLKQYCRSRFGSMAVCLEYPWLGRSPSELQHLGWNTLWALSRP